MAVKFYKCAHCGNIVMKVVDKKVPVMCCGAKMEELVPNTEDAAGEKHVPVITKIDDCRVKVEVGSVAHPMLPEHHISFIYVETENGGIRVDLRISQKRNSVFVLTNLLLHTNIATCMACGRLSSKM